MDPFLRKRLNRFRKNRRAFYSFWIISIAFLLSLFSEVIANNKPLVVYFNGGFYFPIAKVYPAETFGESISIVPDYKKIRASSEFRDSGNWMLFPPIPYGPNESMRGLDRPPPTPPSSSNWLGTDDRGRDLLTRLIYGFRNSMLFALGSWVMIVVLGYISGAVQGFLGGKVDLVGQRLMEIWNALPVLYVVIFLISIFRSSLFLLVMIWVAFSWMGLSSYVRAEVLRIRKMEFVTAATALGFGTPRILFRHILPNAVMPIITLSPFIISASVGSLAALDYLGLGLPPPTSSWGEILRQGKENLNAPWLGFFSFLSLFFTLMLLNFIGEGVRSAFDTRS